MNKQRLLAATFGHLSIDILNSSVAMILTLVAGRFSLTIAQIGFGAMIYQIFAAMSQPLFGGLTDKLRGRWVGSVGLLWTIAFFALASFMPSYSLFIFCLMLGGLGSGAFHAAGMINATVSGGQRPAMATSFFFLGGQTGLALGPTITGLLFPLLGMLTMPLLAAIMLPAAVMMLIFLNEPLPDAPKRVNTGQAPSRSMAQHGAAAVALLAFILFITFRSGTAQGYATLLPKYFQLQGFAPATFGLMLSVFNLAGAGGTLLGGYLGDRYNRRLIMTTSTILSAPFAYLMLHTQGVAYVLVAIAAGVLLSVPHSILLTLAQEVSPQRRGLVGGLTLGFMFASGSTLAWLQAVGADAFGLPVVMGFVAFMPILAGLVGFFLPTRGSVRAAPIRTPAPTASAAD